MMKILFIGRLSSRSYSNYYITTNIKAKYLLYKEMSRINTHELSASDRKIWTYFEMSDIYSILNLVSNLSKI